MAVTIHTTPLQWSPSDNPLTFTFSSNQTAQANFSYIVQTFLNATMVSEDRVFPESSTRAHYDCSPIVKGLMPVPQFKSALYQNAGTNYEVYIKVIENYGSPAIDQASATSSAIDIFKAGLSDEDWETFNAPTTWQNLLFLTNYPRAERIEVLRGHDFYLNMIQDASKTLELKFYSSAGALLHTYTSTQNYAIAQLNLKSTLLTSTAGVPDISLVAYYTVQIGTSEILTIHFLDDYCYSPTALMWLNDYGAYDYFIFEHNLDESGSVEERKYERQYGKWSGTSFGYDASNSGEQRISTNTNKKGIIYTDWITEDQQNWLTELFDSVQFRLYLLSGTYKGISVTSNEFSFKKQRWEDLINETVAFNYSSNHQSLTL